MAFVDYIIIDNLQAFELLHSVRFRNMKFTLHPMNTMATQLNHGGASTLSTMLRTPKLSRWAV